MKQPTAQQVKYWNAQLARYGLSEDAGVKDWIDYGHSVMDLDYDGRIAYRPKETDNEWPISLC